MGIAASQLASVSLASQAGGAAMSTVGSYYSASSQRSSLLASADVADTNARIAELGAQSTLDQGNRQVGALTLKSGQLKSRQRTSMAANGVTVGAGSAAEVLASTDVMTEIDRNTIELNAVRAAWGQRTQATNFQNEARSKRATAGTINPMLSAASTLLGSAGSVAQSWYGMTKTGALDEFNANLTSDPIQTMGASRGWY